MKSFFWRLLSYFYDVPIETVAGRDGVILHLCLSRGQYQLYTRHAIYSYGLHYANFYKIFKKIDIQSFAPDEVLVLGLGLGSIPLMLERSFHLQCAYTAVEYDEAVIYLASKYVLGSLQSSVSVMQADAYAYMQHSTGQYDLICIDIFVDDIIPPEFRSVSFLQAVRKQLSQGGILLFNWLYRDKQSRSEAQQYFDTVFRPVCPKGEMVILGLNAMMLDREGGVTHL